MTSDEQALGFSIIIDKFFVTLAGPVIVKSRYFFPTQPADVTARSTHAGFILIGGEM